MDRLHKLFPKLDRQGRELDKIVDKCPEGMTLLEYMEMIDKPYLTDDALFSTIQYWNDALEKAENENDRERIKIAEERIQYYNKQNQERGL